jgi:hypothetical protein
MEKQILRLTTPVLHPTNDDLFVGTPVRLKKTPGAPFAQDDSAFCGWTLETDDSSQGVKPGSYLCAFAAPFDCAQGRL